MEGRISMSNKELSRLDALTKVHEKRLTISQASSILGLSERQTKRLSKALKNHGVAGIISKKVRAPSNHQLPQSVKEKAIALILEKYSDFGPTLAHEYLTEKDGLAFSISYVRNIMMENKIWLSKKIRKIRVFQLRPRRSKEGELIQLDGSDHDWFEGRGPRCTLLSYIDDATSGVMHLKFVNSENLIDYFIATGEYLKKHGSPMALYPDKHAVFHINREGALSGTGLTQFGRAMKELDIQLICANTPQAKGRVERRHRDFQDRLIKAMRLQNICGIQEANAFLPVFIKDFNNRFAKSPQNTSNAHRPLLPTHNLDRILCHKHERQLSKNLILQYDNIIYQIISERSYYALTKAKVTVLESVEGKVSIEYQGKPLKAVPYHQMQSRTKIVNAKELSVVLDQREKKPYKPGKHHPWKRRQGSFPQRHANLAGCC